MDCYGCPAAVQQDADSFTAASHPDNDSGVDFQSGTTRLSQFGQTYSPAWLQVGGLVIAHSFQSAKIRAAVSAQRPDECRQDGVEPLARRGGTVPDKDRPRFSSRKPAFS